MKNAQIAPAQRSYSIALVHDWLVTYGGSEGITAALMDVWPDSHVFTLLYDGEGPCKAFTTGRQVQTSFLQNLPFSKRNHRLYLPLMPFAVEQFDLSGFDIVVSCSHAVAHGIIPQADQLHINYICIPVRYAWHLYHAYLQENGLQNGLKGLFSKLVLHYLRLWDIAAANRVDEFVAISRWVAKNVWKVYRRRCEVIHPPVDVEAFTVRKKKENYYITVSRLVPYKRVDLIVEAFSDMPSRKLVVIGDGPELKGLRSKAGRNIEFLGFQPFEVMKEYIERAQALVFAAVEDFGIVPVEAQACGTPVIAYGKGGVLETVIDGKTGLFYLEQTAASLKKAVERFEETDLRFDVCELRKQTERFSKERFQKEFSEYVEKRWEIFAKSEIRLPYK